MDLRVLERGLLKQLQAECEGNREERWVVDGPPLMLLEKCRDLNCFPGSSEGKASAYNAGDPSLIPGSGRYPGEGNSNPLQYSCLENPMD